LAITLLAAYLFNDPLADYLPRRRLSSTDSDEDGVHFYLLEDIPGLAVPVYSIVLIIFFIALAVVTDDYFVPSLQVISLRLSLTEDVAGATFMAAGSSAPELFTSLTDVLVFESSIGIGTIVGSAVFNILVIIACSGAFAVETLVIDWRPFMRDCSFYAFSILLLLIFIKLDGSNGKAYWWEGLIMVFSYGFYVLIMVFNSQLMDFLGRLGGVPEKADSDDERPKPLAYRSPGMINDWICYSGSTEMERLQKPLCCAKITILGKGTESPLNLAIFEEFKKQTRSVPGLSSCALDVEEQVIKVVYIKDESNNEANRKLHLACTNAASAAASANNVTVSKVEMNDDPNGTAPRPVPSGAPEAGTDPAQQDTTSNNAGGGGDDDSSDDEPWPGPLRYLQIVVGGISACWDWIFSKTVPGCNTEDAREEYDKMPDGPQKEARDKELREQEKWYVLAFIASILWIAILSFVMVDMSDRIGKIIGFSPVLMGLTVLAAGTSIPDALSSVATAKRGMGDMAVANAIGSNVFDILLGLGIPWTIFGAIHGGDPYPVDLDKIITFVIILFATLILTVLTFIVLKWRLGPRLGQLLLFLYAVFFGLAIIIARN